jgi:hypothetical protein
MVVHIVEVATKGTVRNEEITLMTAGALIEQNTG